MAIVAGPRKKDHVRIVSTTARDPEEVLEDLLDEAEALPMTATGASGEKTTTLLVCPCCASLSLFFDLCVWRVLLLCLCELLFVVCCILAFTQAGGLVGPFFPVGPNLMALASPPANSQPPAVNGWNTWAVLGIAK